MKDIKQRIEKILEESYHDEVSTTPYVNKLIEEVIKPIAKEAFEAGVELGDNNLNITYLSSDDWVKEKFKV